MHSSALSLHTTAAARLGGGPWWPLPRPLSTPGPRLAARSPLQGAPRCAAAAPGTPNAPSPPASSAAANAAAAWRARHRHCHTRRHTVRGAPASRLQILICGSSRREAEQLGPQGRGSSGRAQSPADPTAPPSGALGGPEASAAMACAGASAAAAARPAQCVSRRQVGRLTAAAALLVALGTAPPPVPGAGSGPLTPLPFPSAVGAASAAAPVEQGRESRGPQEHERDQGQGLGHGEVFGYVAAEPLDGPWLGAAAGTPSQAPAAAGPRYFRTLTAAVAECPPGGVVLVAAGRYRERLLLSRPLTLRAWPQGSRVEVVWETPEPYQSTVEVSAGPAVEGGSAGQVALEGLAVRHSSKSVANNFGVFIRGGCSPRLLDCDISSATGAGVGIEGASPQLVGCRVHDCARQGIAIFGATALGLDLDPAIDPGLMYGMTGGAVRDCDVYGNALDGVLVRSGASPDLLDNLIHNNGGVGVNLQDCSGRYEQNTVYDNARGSVSVSALFELEPGDLAGSNSLRGLIRRM